MLQLGNGIAGTTVSQASPPAGTGDGTVSVAEPRPWTESASSSSGGKSVAIAGYEILAELGRGGMGVVYKARQVSLNRLVALKMILSGMHASDRDMSRFLIEAKAVAAMQHPNIVRIYEISQHDGRPYFTLEYLDGGTLSGRLHEGPLPAQEAARIMQQLAEGMAYAHEKGIIHRDIKPANVLFAADGTPKIADFGLAKNVSGDTDPNNESGLTATGAAMGTPSYMPPEQARGDKTQIGPLADVYSLGATLYAMLTGRPPFQGASVVDTLAMVTSQEAVRPSLLAPRLPKDLETICLKCLQKEPANRYRSAQDLAADLGRYLAGEPIVARPVGLLVKGAKWAKRKKAVLLACMAVAVVAACIIGYQAYVAEVERQTVARKHLAEQQQNAIDKAQLSTMSGDFDQARESLDEAEGLGVSTAQIHMLRGQIGMNTDKVQEAIDNFKQAVALLPESVSARALLALGYLEAGEWNLHREILAQALALELKTSEDYMFLGMAQAPYHPEKGVKLLEAAIRKRASVIARLAHAGAVIQLARDRGDVEMAEQAAHEADLVKYLLSDNPLALRYAIQARTVAIYGYQLAGQQNKRDTAITLARKDAEALKRMPHYAYGLFTRWQFLRSLDEQDVLLEELEKDKPGITTEQCVLTLYRRGKLDNAHAAAARFSDLGTLYALLLLCETPDRKTEVMKLYRKAAEDPRTSKWELVGNQLALLLLGQHEESRKICKGYVDQRITSPVKNAEMQRALGFLSGSLSAEDYLKAAGDSRVDQTNVHFFVGLTHLAHGNRQEAREHFRKAVQTGGFEYDHYELCWALLGRMEQDPRWPLWIPIKK
jgi:tetratricopeptide (TPR) repeat protein/tRNA A-37 threonylcarbamoyl transferase component Bud32